MHLSCSDRFYPPVAILSIPSWAWNIFSSSPPEPIKYTLFDFPTIFSVPPPYSISLIRSVMPSLTFTANVSASLFTSTSITKHRSGRLIPKCSWKLNLMFYAFVRRSVPFERRGWSLRSNQKEYFLLSFSQSSHKPWKLVLVRVPFCLINIISYLVSKLYISQKK